MRFPATHGLPFQRSRCSNATSQSLVLFFAGLIVGLLTLIASANSSPLHAQDQTQAAGASQDQLSRADQLAFFEKKIRPVLIENCHACHSSQAEELSSALSLEDAAGWLKGGYSGPAISPGDADKSLLILAVRYSGDVSDMPPDGKLPDEVIADFERWVQMGAPSPAPTKSTPDNPAQQRLAPSANHWSFQPRAEVTAPQVVNTSWPRDALDNFILQRLEAAEISPTADAEPRTWLRRVYLDLVGLPPTPEDLHSFLQDPSPANRAAVVDRLLASPGFGERWGRHWLDVVRYADSTGGGRTRLLPQAWRFRDNVINAFNEDRPFDVFVQQHIAGDLLAAKDANAQRQNIIASGFLALGPYNYEKQDKEQLRMDVVDEQLDTIGRAFLGLTFGCARCHDHKFDPVTASDYYAMAGILRNTQTLIKANVSDWVERDLSLTAEEQAEVDRIAKLTSSIDAQLKQAEQQLQTGAVELGVLGYAPDGTQLGGILLDDALAKKTGAWTQSTSVKPFVGAGYIHDDNAEKGKKSLSFVAQLSQAGDYEVRLAYTHGTNRAPDTAIVIHAADGEHNVLIDQRIKPPLENQFQTLGIFPFDGSAEIVVSNANSSGHVIVDAVQLILQEHNNREPAAANAYQAAQQDTSKQDNRNKQLAQLLEQSKRLTNKLAKLQTEKQTLLASAPPRPKAMSVREEELLEDCAILLGGDVHRAAELVPRGAPALLNETMPQIPDASSGRLELAEWITHPDNPLTARVAVNRIWSHLFGQGIVTTCDNFGAMGTTPSHPELLDYLAAEFVGSGWSTKSLVRRIVLSRTYAQAYADNPDAALADPENRLLWRANRRRLDVEVLRDTILSVSGDLTACDGGPAFPAKHASEFAPLPPTTVRSVYLPVFRNRLDPFFDAFDFVNPSFVNGQREMSTRPSQALYFMNSDFLEDQTRSCAEDLLAQSMSDADRVKLLYERALARSPSKSEQQLLLRYLADSKDAEARRLAWADIVRAVFSSVDFRFVE